MGMADVFARRRAAGRYMSVMPRHKPDPRDLAREFADEQWTPPLSDPAQFAAQGGGLALPIGGGQGMSMAPTTPVSGSLPTQPTIDQMSGTQSSLANMLANLSRATPGGQQMAMGDQAFRQQMASLDTQNAARQQMAMQNDAGRGPQPTTLAELLRALTGYAGTAQR